MLEEVRVGAVAHLRDLRKDRLRLLHSLSDLLEALLEPVLALAWNRNGLDEFLKLNCKITFRLEPRW